MLRPFGSAKDVRAAALHDYSLLLPHERVDDAPFDDNGDVFGVYLAY